MIQLRGEYVTEDPRLDRLKQFDERSRLFRAAEGIEQYPLRSYSWNKTIWLDQGAEGACVGFGCTHELAARPVVVPGLTNHFAREEVYWEAQKIDPWEGGSYPGAQPTYEGSSVLAGVKVLQARGFLSEYRWAFGEEDLARTIGYRGPVVLGLNWYEGMFDADGDGFIHVDGGLAGGHCILAAGFSLKLDAYRLDNSWGIEWGVNGSCYLSRSDMSRLLAEDGEACIFVKRGKGAI